MPLPLIDDTKPKRAAPEDHVEAERARIAQAITQTGTRVGVHSGKGGVGKTFVACDLALLLATEGYAVGLLDADVDCPNVHEFLGLEGRHELDDAGRIVPRRHPRFANLAVVSTGFLQEKGEPLIIRGPIKHRILTDFLEKTAWGPLDYLVIDFPPGTSDVPLSAMQFAQLAGVILVTTPQREAVADVTRAAAMARKLDIPVLGLVSNMEGEVFGHAGERLAKELAVPLLGTIPLSKAIRETNERGDIAFLEDGLAPLASALLEKLAR